MRVADALLCTRRQLGKKSPRGVLSVASNRHPSEPGVTESSQPVHLSGNGYEIGRGAKRRPANSGFDR